MENLLLRLDIPYENPVISTSGGRISGIRDLNGQVTGKVTKKASQDGAFGLFKRCNLLNLPQHTLI
jgi:hypothetical protein